MPSRTLRLAQRDAPPSPRTLLLSSLDQSQQTGCPIHRALCDGWDVNLLPIKLLPLCSHPVVMRCHPRICLAYAVPSLPFVFAFPSRSSAFVVVFIILHESSGAVASANRVPEATVRKRRAFSHWS